MTPTPARVVRSASTVLTLGHPRPRRLLVLGAALGFATVLAACGDSKSSTPEGQLGAGTVTTQGPGTSVVASTSPTTLPVAPAGATPPSTGPSVTSSTLPPKPSSPYVRFLMPSENIGCAMQADGSVRCDIRQHDWARPEKPASCNYDYGDAFVVGAQGDGRISCASDTVFLASAPVLPYGSSMRQGPYQCRSELSGVECTNLDSGHGFSLSAANYRLF